MKQELNKVINKYDYRMFPMALNVYAKYGYEFFEMADETDIKAEKEDWMRTYGGMFTEDYIDMLFDFAKELSKFSIFDLYQAYEEYGTREKLKQYQTYLYNAMALLVEHDIISCETEALDEIGISEDELEEIGALNLLWEERE